MNEAKPGFQLPENFHNLAQTMKNMGTELPPAEDAQIHSTISASANKDLLDFLADESENGQILQEAFASHALNCDACAAKLMKAGEEEDAGGNS